MSKDNFTSKLGIVAATAGSAVGLGNLWGFPYKAGTNGGGYFVLMYLFSILFIGLPVLLAEFIIGREGKGGPVGSIEKISGSKKSPFVIGGYMGALSTFLILSFYSVIAGWSINYLCTSLVTGFSKFTSDGFVPDAYFETVSGNVPVQLVFQGFFILLTVFVVMFGIQNGIEKISKIMMPLLFLIIIALVIYSCTLSGFNDAVNFLFKPAHNIDKSVFSVFADALGQAFFSLSLGMGAIITYARAVPDNENINTISVQVALCDTAIALLAGLATFPIIFTYGMDPASGAGLAFIALPVAFSEMPFGYIFGNLFFLLLVIAALTSSIAMLENTLTLVLEKTKINRKVATIGLGILVFFFGTLSQAGVGYSSSLLSFTGGVGFLDQLDKVTMNYLIPLGALFFILLVGHRMDPAVVRRQINNDKIANFFIPYIKYVAPIFVSVIFIAGLFN